MAEPVNTADPLFEDRRIPGKIEMDQHTRRLQIQPHATRIRGQKDLGRRIVVA